MPSKTDSRQAPVATISSTTNAKVPRARSVPVLTNVAPPKALAEVDRNSVKRSCQKAKSCAKTIVEAKILEVENKPPAKLRRSSTLGSDTRTFRGSKRVSLEASAKAPPEASDCGTLATHAEQSDSKGAATAVNAAATPDKEPRRCAASDMARDMAQTTWLAHGSFEEYAVLKYILSVLERRPSKARSSRKRLMKKREDTTASKNEQNAKAAAVTAGDHHATHRHVNDDVSVRELADAVNEPQSAPEFLVGSSTSRKAEPCVGYTSSASGRAHCLVPKHTAPSIRRTETTRVLRASQVDIRPAATCGRILELEDGTSCVVESFDPVSTLQRSCSIAAQFDAENLSQTLSLVSAPSSSATSSLPLPSPCGVPGPKVEPLSGLRNFFSRWGRK